MSARRILVIFNPAAGSARRPRFDSVVAQLEAASCRVDVVETTGARPRRDLGAQCHTRRLRCRGRLRRRRHRERSHQRPRRQGRRARGIIPLGTANVLAEEIGLVRTPEKIAAALSHGPIRTVHVGRANGRRFTMMAGVGFDAVVVSRVSLKLKKIAGSARLRMGIHAPSRAVRLPGP
jgi:diacylglycerol kinase (ATP)